MADMRGRLIIVAFVVAVVAAAVGIIVFAGGDGDEGDQPPTGDTGSPSAQTPSGGTPLTGSPIAPASTTDASPDATEQVLASAFRHLAGAVLSGAEIPAGYDQRTNGPISKRDAVASNVLSIRKLSEYLDQSDLRALWASFYTRQTRDAALSSIVYEFGSPEGAQGLVATLAGLQQADYPVTKSVERVQSDKIGDSAQMMLYVLEGTNSLEYTWAQGRYAGQVIYRSTGEAPPPEEVQGIVALARAQSAKMAQLR